MCDFKPGDEVVYIGDEGVPKIPEHGRCANVSRGDTFTVVGVSPWRDTDLIALILHEHPGKWFDARCFRKVQRRDLTAWLATENTIEDPIRKREKA